jgi:hypothetical protein
MPRTLGRLPNEDRACDPTWPLETFVARRRAQVIQRCSGKKQESSPRNKEGSRAKSRCEDYPEMITR